MFTVRTRFSGKTILFVSCIVAGICAISSSVFVFLLPSLIPSVSVVEPNYCGLGVMVNRTNISPTSLLMIVTVEPYELYFRYFFICDQNGTYNFLFGFPFNITRKISSHPEDMMFNSTFAYGSAVWLQFDSNGTGPRDIAGHFEIGVAFKSGSTGTYTFVLPCGFGLRQEVIDDLKTQLNVTYPSKNHVDLYFNIPYPDYVITRTFPESQSSWMTIPDISRNLTGVRWIFPDGLEQSIIIHCQSLGEIQSNQLLLFLGGVILSIGFQLVVRGSYDLVKSRLADRSNEEQIHTGWCYPDESIWVKCKNCKKWNEVSQNMSDFHPKTNPYRMKCHRCKSLIVIGRKALAPKNRKKPTDP